MLAGDVGVSHRGSGRDPNTIANASHLDAADLAQAISIRRDRLVKRQSASYAWNAERQGEIDMLGEVYRLLRAYDEQRHAPPLGVIPEASEHDRLLFEDSQRRRLNKGRDIGT